MADTMELRNFISTSLKEIILGVRDVQNDSEVQETGAAVSPPCRCINTEKRIYEVDEKYSDVDGQYDKVEFDIAVTANSGTETKGGVGVVAGVFALGSQGKSDSASGVFSRLRFSVPIVLPVKSRKPNQ